MLISMRSAQEAVDSGALVERSSFKPFPQKTCNYGIEMNIAPVRIYR